MQVILPELAMVCIHRGCAVIFEGPSRVCPLCGWQGTPYTDIEELATSAVFKSQPEPKVLTPPVQ
jgi:rRNA maturation endonuclease Nob1